MKNKLKNENGQMAIEMLLIMITLFIAITFVSKQMKDQGFLASLVQSPWTQLAGMIESGSWAKAEDARTQHPNNQKRHISYRGDNR